MPAVTLLLVWEGGTVKTETRAMTFYRSTSPYHLSVHMNWWCHHPLLSHSLRCLQEALNSSWLSSPLSKACLQLLKTNMIWLWQLFCSNLALLQGSICSIALTTLCDGEEGLLLVMFQVLIFSFFHRSGTAVLREGNSDWLIPGYPALPTLGKYLHFLEWPTEYVCRDQLSLPTTV